MEQDNINMTKFPVKYNPKLLTQFCPGAGFKYILFWGVRFKKTHKKLLVSFLQDNFLCLTFARNVHQNYVLSYDTVGWLSLYYFRNETNWTLITVQQDATVFSLLHFRRQLYIFRVLVPIIRSSNSCNYSFWHWSAGSATIRSRC